MSILSTIVAFFSPLPINAETVTRGAGVMLRSGIPIRIAGMNTDGTYRGYSITMKQYTVTLADVTEILDYDRSIM